MRTSWQVFHDRSVAPSEIFYELCPADLGELRSCVVFSCQFTPSTTGQSYQECCFLAGAVLEWNLTHWRYVAVLCMLFKIKSSPIHPSSGALPLPYFPARVTRGALVPHMYSFVLPRYGTSQYRRTFVYLSVYLWNDLSNPVFYRVGLAVFKSRANAFLLA